MVPDIKFAILVSLQLINAFESIYKAATPYIGRAYIQENKKISGMSLSGLLGTNPVFP
jgi:uncharacterized membrane protein YjfL (UPF0719 family)